MVRVVGKGDAEIRVLPDVVDVVPGTAERLAVTTENGVTADTTVPHGVTRDRLTERIHGERNRSAREGASGTAAPLRIEGGEGDPRERDVGFGRIFELDGEARL